MLRHLTNHLHPAQPVWRRGNFEYPPPSNKKPYKVEITEVGDETGDGRVGLSDVEYLLRNNKNVLTLLEGDGDFRSDECIELLKQADIVVTNPPFSLFREYIAQLIEYDKKFVVIGNQNAITYKEIFPLIASNQLWLGFHSGHTLFAVPDDYSIPDFYNKNDKNKLRSNGYIIDSSGKLWRNLGNICWFTNLDIAKRHENLILYKNYTPDEYPHYDNYDAINVDKVSDIPCDYYGVMGVPITFLDKYNPDQFEIVAFRKGDDGKDLVYSLSDNSQSVNVERERERDERYSRTSESSSGANRLIPRRRDSSDTEWEKTLSTYNSTSSTSIPGMIKNAEGKIGGKITYARITIRRRKSDTNED